VRHLGILAHSTEGAALCFLAFCQEGFRELGVHQHPDVTMDCIAMGRSMPAWEAGEHQSIRATLAESAERLARSGADFFVCPDNTAHLARRPLLTGGGSTGPAGIHLLHRRLAGRVKAE
jgi:aspartate/glutamate racemase